MVEFSTTLADALAPITLISGVGLLLVSMSARYGHATTRIRQLMAERSDSPDEVKLLKNGVLTVALSAAFSSLQVLFITIEHLFNLDLSVWKSAMLLASVIFIVLSSCIYVSEVQISVRALGVSVHHHDRPQ